MAKNLFINLSMLMSKPTGITIYADSIFPYFTNLNPTLLIAQNNYNFNCYLIPKNLTSEQGTVGHFRRLLWTQFKLPKIYKKLEGSLLFSPVPEAPLYTNCQSVVMVHDLIPLRFPKKNSPLTPYFKNYIPQVLKQARHILCNSQATATDIIDFFGISAKKITPILLAYNSNHFRPLKFKKKIRSKTSLPYFLYLGRHDLHKNLSRLIKAFAGIRNYQNYELWLAGQTDKRYTPKLQQQATELGIRNQIKFLDYVSYNQLPILLNQALALVFPSLWEGFGFPVLEAMGCGTPVITSNSSSLPELAGDAGLLINPYQVSEITDAMEQIINDDGLRSQLKTLSLQQSSQFSWQKTGNSTLEVLKRFL
ncbi:glycosyltransferase family 4 protein [cyanobacterium endosymbiont of Epithemia turgida]|uniref:glycosyltransferase family 4 protein n=1 Tax=cyanobacterium endosymbiont of Epithemia turgida TaxID=718217 RepID=UPI0004D131A8|nr:glycosyltransferase family 1 protein [cyanobacterium endosymbiont of Epithemia turgida]BAP17630.1 mannosyl transferase [cyanobacterium endosymbiont of Epithemia turgida isolate EtSB Lake Yunoko]